MKYLAIILAFVCCLTGRSASSTVGANSSGVLTAPTNFFTANIGVVSVKTFGAIGDGSTDDTAAIQRAITYAKTFVTSSYNTHRPTLLFPPALGYKITSAITVGTNINVQMDGPIVSGISGGNVAAMTIGVAGSYSANLNLKLAIRRSTQSDWTDEADIGVKIYGLTSSRVHLWDIQGFTIGVQFMGDAQGIQENEINLGAIYNCKVKIDGSNKNSGWFNSNQIRGGRITDDNSVNTTLSRYGIRITSSDGSYHNNNANVIRDVSFEMKGSLLTDGAEAIPWLVVYGRDNRMEGAWRSEGNAGYAARFQNDSVLNFVYPAGYTDSPTQGGANIDNQSTLAGNMQVGRTYVGNSFTALPNFKIFDSGPLYRNAIRHFGTNWYSISGVHFAASANSNIVSTTSGIAVYTDYVDLPSSVGLGVLVDLEKCKHVIAVKDTVSPSGGQWVIRCYDSSGAVIANPGAGGYVKGSIGLADTASWGGGARTGDIADLPMMFEFSSAVKRADFITSGNNTNCTIRSFSLYSADGNPGTAWPGYFQINSGIQANEIPNEAGKIAGQFVWNESGSGPMGWKYSGSGSVWNAFGGPSFWNYDAVNITAGFNTAASGNSNTWISLRKDFAGTSVAFLPRNADAAGVVIIQLDGEGNNTTTLGTYNHSYSSSALRNYTVLNAGSTNGLIVEAPTSGQVIQFWAGDTTPRVKITSSGLELPGGYMAITTNAEPSAPSAGQAKLWLDISGGKEILKVRFPSGASQTLATEP